MSSNRDFKFGAQQVASSNLASPSTRMTNHPESGVHGQVTWTI